MDRTDGQKKRQETVEMESSDISKETSHQKTSHSTQTHAVIMPSAYVHPGQEWLNNYILWHLN